MKDLEQLIQDYWKIVRGTRKSGRIAPSVIIRVQEQWKRYDKDVVMEALRIHISRYREYKEAYTIGIMRNLQKQKDAGGRIKTGNPFNTGMEQQDYDFEQLEKEILAN